MSPLLATILIPFLTALACLITPGKPTLNRALGVAGAALMTLNAFWLLSQVNCAGIQVIAVGSWVAPFGITLVADLLSAIMVAVCAVVALGVAIYSWHDVDDAMVRKQYYALFSFLMMGVNGAFVTGDLFNLYVWFEIMLLSSFVLITMEGRKDQLEGGVKYLIINLVSSLLFLCGIGLIYGKTGSLNMADLAVRLEMTDDALLINSSAVLLFAAFCIKAAMFPFFFWLPASYHTPRVAISALFAGLLTKVGVYALMRLYTLILQTQFEVIQEVLLWLSAGTMVTGVLGAAVHYEIRKILSFHIVSQIGYIVMGLAIHTPLAIAAAIFYTVHHILVKTNLFLIGGLIARRTGSEQLKHIGGLYKAAPALALLFFIPAFSLGGIPPLSGFWAKYGVVKAGLLEGHYTLVGCALLVGILTLYSMTKIWGEAFWKAAPQAADNPQPSASSAATAISGTLLWPCIGMAALTVCISLWAAPLFDISMAASEELLNPQAYIQAVLGPAVAP